jgi:hypothetical protein
MDGTRHSGAKEPLETQNIRSGNLKDYEAHTRSAKAKGSRTWNSLGSPSLEARARDLAARSPAALPSRAQVKRFARELTIVRRSIPLTQGLMKEAAQSL